MAKFVLDAVMDEALNYIKNNSTNVVVCNGQPTTYNEAMTNKGTTVAGGGTARRLGHSTLSSTELTVANGDTSGRKVTLAQKTGINIDVTSTGADHVALVNTSTAGNELLLVTTISSPQTVNSGNTATVNAFDDEIRDPT